jgi:hypothetical protein
VWKNSWLVGVSILKIVDLNKSTNQIFQLTTNSEDYTLKRNYITSCIKIIPYSGSTWKEINEDILPFLKALHVCVTFNLSSRRLTIYLSHVLNRTIVMLSNKLYQYLSSGHDGMDVANHRKHSYSLRSAQISRSPIKS